MGFSPNKNVSSIRKQTVVFFTLLAHYGIFKMTFNMCIHKEIYLRNAGIGRSPLPPLPPPPVNIHEKAPNF